MSRNTHSPFGRLKSGKRKPTLAEVRFYSNSVRFFFFFNFCVLLLIHLLLNPLFPLFPYFSTTLFLSSTSGLYGPLGHINNINPEINSRFEDSWFRFLFFVLTNITSQIYEVLSSTYIPVIRVTFYELY